MNNNSHSHQIIADYNELRSNATVLREIRERAWQRLFAQNPDADRRRFDKNFSALLSTLRQEEPELEIPYERK